MAQPPAFCQRHARHHGSSLQSTACPSGIRFSHSFRSAPAALPPPDASPRRRPSLDAGQWPSSDGYFAECKWIYPRQRPPQKKKRAGPPEEDRPLRKVGLGTDSRCVHQLPAACRLKEEEPLVHDGEHGHGEQDAGRTVEDARRLISLYFQMIKGKITPEELDDLEDVAALQGIAHVPARVKCAVLAWHTLEEALDGEGKTDKVTTEDAE